MTHVLPFLLLLAGEQTAAAQYTVRIDDSLRTAEITVTLPAGTTRLLMDSVQAEHLPKGWATFVRDLDVRSAGRSVVVTPGNGAEWKLPPDVRGPVTLAYRIDLAFARTPWPAGNEQAGAAFDDALYIVGRALYIVSDVATGAEVTFDVPREWRVSIPLPSRRSNARVFIAANRTELVRNAVVLGRHESVRATAGTFELELALPGVDRGAIPIVEPVVRAVLPAYLSLFPDTPPQKYLMAFFRSTADDGEAFTSSAAFTTTDSIIASGTIVWGNFLAHELMHFWNGQRIRGAGARTTWRWLAEGFTEYYANVTLARQGVISPELFLKKAERHLGNYLYFATAPSLSRMSLSEAGTNTTANRFGVYDGGWTVAFCLDGLIREQSRDARSLDDFMRELWRRFGSSGRGYTIPDLETLAAELSGSDLGNFLATYVEGRATLPVRACLGRVGLTAAIKGYAAEAFVFTDSSASPIARARGRAMYGARN